MAFRNHTQSARRALPFVALAALVPLALAGCATTSPTASVVRFHDAAAPRSGTIAVAPAADTGAAPTLETSAYEGAIAAALARHGLTAAPAGTSAAYVALYSLSTVEHTQSGGGSGLTVGLGGGFGGGNVGMGGSVAIPVGRKGEGKTIRATTLRLQIREKTAEGPILWEGRASVDGRADSALGRSEEVVPLLADAVLADYPGPSTQTTTVPLPASGR